MLLYSCHLSLQIVYCPSSSIFCYGGLELLNSDHLLRVILPLRWLLGLPGLFFFWFNSAVFFLCLSNSLQVWQYLDQNALGNFFVDFLSLLHYFSSR